MSQENVEIVRRQYELWNEWRDPDAVAEILWHEEVEWIEPSDSLDAGVYRGRTAAAGYLREWVAHMGPTPVVVEELLAAGDEVVAYLRVHLRGTASGVPVETHIFHVMRIRGGRVDRIRPFYTREEALEAVGLRE